MEVLDRADAVRTALSPLRRQLLARLHEPASATALAVDLGLARQRVNYHLRALADAGLIEVVQERQRRGFVERVYRASPGGFVVDPAVIGGSWEQITDQYAAEHLVATAARMVGDVGRQATAASAQGKRLMTFTVECQARFESPRDVQAFTDELAQALQDLVDKYDTPGGRRHRLVALGHPCAAVGAHPSSSDVSEGDEQ